MGCHVAAPPHPISPPIYGPFWAQFRPKIWVSFFFFFLRKDNGLPCGSPLHTPLARPLYGPLWAQFRPIFLPIIFFFLIRRQYGRPSKNPSKQKISHPILDLFFFSENLIFFFIFYYLGYTVYPLGHSFKALALSP